MLPTGSAIRPWPSGKIMAATSANTRDGSRSARDIFFNVFNHTRTRCADFVSCALQLSPELYARLAQRAPA
jgi:hypothetical protein